MEKTASYYLKVPGAIGEDGIDENLKVYADGFLTGRKGFDMPSDVADQEMLASTIARMKDRRIETDTDGSGYFKSLGTADKSGIVRSIPKTPAEKLAVMKADHVRQMEWEMLLGDMSSNPAAIGAMATEAKLENTLLRLEMPKEDFMSLTAPERYKALQDKGLVQSVFGDSKDEVKRGIATEIQQGIRTVGGWMSGNFSRSSNFDWDAYNQDDDIHVETVRTGMKSLGADSPDDFAAKVREKVGGGVFSVGGDAFMVDVVGKNADGTDKLQLYVAQDGETQMYMGLVDDALGKLGDETGAIDALYTRMVLDANPDVEKLYAIGAKDKGKLVEAIMEDYSPFLDGRETTPEADEERSRRFNNYMLTFQLLGLRDNSSRLAIANSADAGWLKRTATGGVNLAMDKLDGLLKFLPSSVRGYDRVSKEIARMVYDVDPDSDKTAFRDFISDVARGLDDGFYDQGTFTGEVVSGALDIVTLGAIMKYGRLSTLTRKLPGGINAARGNKLIKAGTAARREAVAIGDEAAADIAAETIDRGRRLLADGMKLRGDVGPAQKALNEAKGVLEKTGAWQSAWEDIKTIADEAPALAAMTLSGYDERAVGDAYVLGQKMERGFDASAVKVARKWEFVDSASSTAFFMHLGSLGKDILNGVRGTPKLRGSLQRFCNNVEKLISEGKLAEARAYAKAFKAATTLADVGDLFVTGTAMDLTSSYVGNAKDVDVRKAMDPSYIPTVDDYLITPEQAASALQAGIDLVEKGTVASGVGGIVKTKAAYDAGKRGDNIILDVPSEILKAAEWDGARKRKELGVAAVRNVLERQGGSKDGRGATALFLEVVRRLEGASAKDGGRRGDNYARVRREIVSNLGEGVARQADALFSEASKIFALKRSGEIDARSTSPADDIAAAMNAIKYAERSDWKASEIVDMWRDLLGVDATLEGNNQTAAVAISANGVDTTGKVGISKGVVSEGRRTGGKDDAGRPVFSPDWARQAVSVATTEDPTARKSFGIGSQFDSVREKISKLDAEARRALDEGRDVDGILSELDSLFVEEKGMFERKEGGKTVGTVYYDDIPGMGARTVTHEPVHAVLEMYRRAGVLTPEIEDALKGKYGEKWEETVIAHIQEQARTLDLIRSLSQVLGPDGINKARGFMEAVRGGVEFARRLFGWKPEVREKLGPSLIDRFVEGELAEAKAKAEVPKESDRTDGDAADDVARRGNDFLDRAEKESEGAGKDGTDIEMPRGTPWPEAAANGADSYEMNGGAKDADMQWELVGDDKLVASTNMEIRKLYDALFNKKRKGSLVAPAFAVKRRASGPHIAFGSFSLLVPKYVVDPSDKDTVLFDRDVGSYMYSGDVSDMSNTKLISKIRGADIGSGLVARDWDYSLVAGRFEGNFDDLRKSDTYGEAKRYRPIQVANYWVVAPRISDRELSEYAQRGEIEKERVDKFIEFTQKYADLGIDVTWYDAPAIALSQYINSPERTKALDDAIDKSKVAFELVGRPGLDRLSGDPEYIDKVLADVYRGAVGKEFKVGDNVFIPVRDAYKRGVWAFYDPKAKVKMPQAFLKRLVDGEVFHVSDLIGNTAENDDVLSAAYPGIANARIRIVQRRRFGNGHEYDFKVPPFHTGKDEKGNPTGFVDAFILANEDGEIVIDKDRWNERKAKEQFKKAVGTLIVNADGSEPDITGSESASLSAIYGGRAKRSGSDLALWLSDMRFVSKDEQRSIIRDAVRRHIARVKPSGMTEEGVLDKAIDAISRTIAGSADKFAGSVEARILGETFGMDAKKAARHYSRSVDEVRDALIGITSKNTTSADATERVLKFYDRVAMNAVDEALYGKHKKGEHRPSLAQDFKDAVATEIFRAVCDNILRGTRATRTLGEAEETGVSVGDKLNSTRQSLGRAAYSGESVDVAVDTEGNRIEDGGGSRNGTAMIGATGVGASGLIDMAEVGSIIRSDEVWTASRDKVVSEIRKLVLKMKQEIAKDMSKAATFKDDMMARIDKLISENSKTTNKDALKTMRSDVVQEALGIKEFELSGMRDGDEMSVTDHITEAAAARFARGVLSRGSTKWHRSSLEKFVSEQLTKLGMKANPDDVRQIVGDAEAIGMEIADEVDRNASDAAILAKVKSAGRRNRIISRVFSSFADGYDIGAYGSAAEFKAKQIAQAAKTRAVKEACGASIVEIDAIAKMSTLADIEKIGADGSEFKDAEEFAAKMVGGIGAHIMAKHGIGDPAEIVNDPVARQELALTVSSWLKQAAKMCVYGKPREGMIRDSERILHMNATFPFVQNLIAHHARIAQEYMRRHKVADLIADIGRFIDENAMGSKRMNPNMSAKMRLIDPDLQFYWKSVKKAMSMTEEAVGKRVSELEAELGLSQSDEAKLSGEDADKVGGDEAIERRFKRMMELKSLLDYGALRDRTYAEVRDLFTSEIAPDISTRAREYVKSVREEQAKRADARGKIIGELREQNRRDINRGKVYDEKGSAGRNFLVGAIPDLFKRLQLFFRSDSDAHAVLTGLRREMSLANIDSAVFTSKFETQFRAAFKTIYGRSFESMVPELTRRRPEFSAFSRLGWTIKDDAPVEEEVVVNGKRRHGVRLASPGPNSKNPMAADASLSLANLMYIYASIRQGDMAVNNYVYGRDAAYIDALERAIGPNGIAMVNWMTTAYENMRTLISPVAERVTGMKVRSPGDFYSPLVFDRDDISSDARRYSVNLFPGFLTRRHLHDSSRLAEQTDIFRLFENRISACGHYVGYTELIDKCNDILKHGTVQEAYTKVFGKRAKDEIYSQLASALDGGRKDARGLFNGVRNFVTASSLFYNLGSAIKQIEGIGGWAVAVGLKNWMKGVASRGTFVFDGKSRQGTRELVEQGLFLARSNEGISESVVALMDATTNEVDGKKRGLLAKVRDLYYNNGMLFTRVIDHIATRSLAGSYYANRKQFFLDGGYDEATAKRLALADVDYAVQISQQSGRQEFLHEAQRKGTFGKMLAQFSGPSLIRFGEEIEAAHRAFVLGDKGSYKNLFSKIVALHVICPAILSFCGSVATYALSDGSKTDDEMMESAQKDMMLSCLLGPMSGWFIFGQLINAGVYDAVMHDVPVSSKTRFNTPIFSKLDQLRARTASIAREMFDAANIGLAPWESDDVVEECVKLMQSFFPALRLANPIRRIADN